MQSLLQANKQVSRRVTQVAHYNLSHNSHLPSFTNLPSTQVIQIPVISQVKQSELHANTQLSSDVTQVAHLLLSQLRQSPVSKNKPSWQESHV